MARILVDSDVFVDHLRGFRRLAVGRDEIHYSTVTRAELFAGRANQESKIRRLLEPFAELPVDRAIAERAGRLRRTLPIRVPNAVIAATCLENRLTLVTRNSKDFAHVPRLRLRAPD